MINEMKFNEDVAMMCGLKEAVLASFLWDLMLRNDEAVYRYGKMWTRISRYSCVVKRIFLHTSRTRTKIKRNIFIVTFYTFDSHIYEGGERMDIEKLYQQYFSVVYKYVLSISRDPLTAEEITQETFFKALKKIDTFRGDSSVKVWLCQIAKNAYYDFIKHESRHTELADEYGEPQGSAEEDFLVKADAKALHVILHSLSEPYKEVFSLRTFGELSFSDIGELFGKSDSWARVTYHRAKLMIKEEMGNGKHNM